MRPKTKAQYLEKQRRRGQFDQKPVAPVVVQPKLQSWFDKDEWNAEVEARRSKKWAIPALGGMLGLHHMKTAMRKALKKVF
jgi:hypothetical protein